MTFPMYNLQYPWISVTLCAGSGWVYVSGVHHTERMFHLASDTGHRVLVTAVAARIDCGLESGWRARHGRLAYGRSYLEWRESAWCRTTCSPEGSASRPYDGVGQGGVERAGGQGWQHTHAKTDAT